MKTTHLLFDFFGTLVDYSDRPMGEGYGNSFKLLSRYGYEGDYETLVSTWTDTYTQLDEEAARTHEEFSLETLVAFILEKLLGYSENAMIGEVIETYIQEWNKEVIYYPDLPDLLSRLNGRYSLGIITNTHLPDLVPNHLSNMGVLDYFDSVVTSVEQGVRKPGREIFDHAVKSIDTTPDRCVYVGDNFRSDYEGARSAGIESYLIDPDKRSPVPDSSRLDSILELEKYI